MMLSVHVLNVKLVSNVRNGSPITMSAPALGVARVSANVVGTRRIIGNRYSHTYGYPKASVHIGSPRT